MSKSFNRILFIGIFIVLLLIFIHRSDWRQTNKPSIVVMEGHSMEPFINEGNVVAFTPSNTSIELNDIVVYKYFNAERMNYVYVAHRVIEKGYDKNGLYYKTKGDNNQYIDPVILRQDDILGEITYKCESII